MGKSPITRASERELAILFARCPYNSYINRSDHAFVVARRGLAEPAASAVIRKRMSHEGHLSRRWSLSDELAPLPL